MRAPAPTKRRQRGGVGGDEEPASRKRGRNNGNNGNNGNNENRPAGPQQPPAGPDSAFERALNASPPMTHTYQVRPLQQLLAAEHWRTTLSADIIVKMVKLHPGLLTKLGGEAIWVDSDEQQEEITKALVALALEPEQPGDELSPLDNLLERTGPISDEWRDSVTGDTPLHTAIQRGMVWSAATLVGHGAEFFSRNRQQQTAMDLVLASPLKHAFIKAFVLAPPGPQSDPPMTLVFEALPEEEREEIVNNTDNRERATLLDLVKFEDQSAATVAEILRYASPAALAFVSEGITLLHFVVWKGRCNWIMGLLDRGANADALSTGDIPRIPRRPLDMLLTMSTKAATAGLRQTSEYWTALERLVASTSVEGVQEALAGAPANTPARIMTLLQARLPPNPTIAWQGWTQDDVATLESVFEPTAAKHFSACPVCLRTVVRDLHTCNYMSHDCTRLPGPYHTRLYNMYRDAAGNVSWCTICNRVAIGHNHYKLALAQDTTLPGTIEPTDVYADGVCHQDGGGDLPEKVARFRRLREFALELQEDVGRITAQDAKQQMVEEMWNAPLNRSKASERAVRDGRWNIPSDRFPPPRAAPNVEGGPAPELRRPAANAADPSLRPVLHADALDMISDVVVPQAVQFRHRRQDGTVNTHEGQFIGTAELTDRLRDLVEGLPGAAGVRGLPQHGAEEFGMCWHPQCGARLYPEEVQPFVPADLYEAYRLRFNDKFRGAVGGGKRSGRGTRRLPPKSHHRGGGGGLRVTSDADGGLLQPLEDGQCALPPTQGGGRAKGRRGQRGQRHTRCKVR